MTRSYVTNLRKGRIENPGYEKMRAIAKAMGFPPEAWFDEMPAGGQRAVPEEGRGLAGRVERLFGAVRHLKTAEPYTSAEVARMSAGDLTGDEVEKIRTGVISDPTVKQVAAFGVPPSYLLDRGRDPSVLDEEVLEALADDTAGAIIRQSATAREGEGDCPRDRATVRQPARRRRRPLAPAPAPHQYAPCSSATKAFEVA